jgi:hypothetical protein
MPLSWLDPHVSAFEDFVNGRAHNLKPWWTLKPRGFKPPHSFTCKLPRWIPPGPEGLRQAHGYYAVAEVRVLPHGRDAAARGVFFSLTPVCTLDPLRSDRIVFPEYALSQDRSLRCFVCCTHILATCTENRTSLGERTRPGDVTRVHLFQLGHVNVLASARNIDSEIACTRIRSCIGMQALGL